MSLENTLESIMSSTASQTASLQKYVFRSTPRPPCLLSVGLADFIEVSFVIEYALLVFFF
jgi:hypothetical protein